MKAAIIANPASGKDIRRIVAHGSVFDNQEKVRMVRRILVGLAAAGVRDVLYMPEGYGIVPRALSDLETLETPVNVTPVDIYLHNTQQDTVNAAALMQEAGVAVIIVLGGDGTSRAACKGARNTPLLPLSTGTNNVFPIMTEATVAGLAAGVLACGGVSVGEGCTEVSLLEVLVDDTPVDIALVDVAVSDNLFVGSRALWDMSDVSQLFFSRCNPACIGFSAVGGQLDSIRPEEPRGLALDIDPDFACRVRAAIGPGLFADVGVSGMHKMLPGDVIAVRQSPCTLALDGEREVEVRKGQRAGVRLSDDWLRVVDVQRTLEYARQRGLFMRGAQVCYSR
ncbi:NAD(+)/NADH kinase [Desulfovibrio sp. 86]|uniref:ATP-NAD/AcoX kinase n=1 Tax=uncultured Desulfovibrio sp. TaxID=167968 RepID=A0A212L9T4_9BACT|nr:NAD(+)/NADH kinase [Desulfovibrio sp. 86]SCM74344.1 ATP-NAD/AcoX kinase [uncultured Desulfovibrio sp.]VZH34776.1 ATP-NAD/AcoX kinase [Desulfovibrio sp. 86]